MKVYLIRHGETVDNVAGLYAGVRDSALTIHGVEQARRLGEHFAKTNNIHLTHIFASPLSRAFKTAEALLKAQGHDTAGDGGDKDTLAIVKVPDLIEQDFGYYEGRPFYARSEAKKSGREAHYERHKDDPDFVDVESKESMCKRADAFLDDHFMPLLDGQGVEDGLEVAIVSHEVTAARGSIVLEHLGGWSNTGYLELAMSRDTGSAMLAAVLTDAARGAEVPDALICPTPTSPTPIAAEESAVVNPDAPSAAPSSPPRKTSTAHSPTASRRTLMGWSTHILVVDSKAHLSGLKRQRGGIGRLAHDEGQKKLTGFFKRQKKG
ncbi:hypothetical protein LTR02_013663 [Friedmanniomyces endolithicus]|nr:hypothetical protein LTR75_005656 [Friedmanniomyces endolithicus]KAK0812897.1 hypothetical protein LTR59_001274 [Friedmanniomyces endolithicus]KAK0820213.1 hypothetical protein LTR38_000121 [Friedmanniomyces endolithicus]KAK0831185.1 hypothetical protein LTR03_015647 [Friedmanniomyces endolithicus]KAK0870511.1 hypothetical protein LTR87_013257 [Friedmanniomyces endolithicus]